MIYKTFEEWNKEGYRIIRGEKSRRRNRFGVPLFDETQITDIEISDSSIEEDQTFEHEHHYGFGD